jgi:hypothetical protein
MSPARGVIFDRSKVWEAAVFRLWNGPKINPDESPEKWLGRTGVPGP